MSRIASFLALCLLLGACGASENAVSSGVSSNQIDVRELSYPAEMFTAYQIVRRHKSNWLRKRGRASFENPTPIKVYLDNTGSPYGDIEVLQNIGGMDVATIEYFGAGEAQLKFGLGHRSGAILVRTRSSE